LDRSKSKTVHRGDAENAERRKIESTKDTKRHEGKPNKQFFVSFVSFVPFVDNSLLCELCVSAVNS
jgi:hypothetical protein